MKYLAVTLTTLVTLAYVAGVPHHHHHHDAREAREAHQRIVNQHHQMREGGLLNGVLDGGLGGLLGGLLGGVSNTAGNVVGGVSNAANGVVSATGLPTGEFNNLLADVAKGIIPKDLDLSKLTQSQLEQLQKVLQTNVNTGVNVTQSKGLLDQVTGLLNEILKLVQALLGSLLNG